MDVERQSRFDYPAGPGAHRIRYFNDVPNTYYKHNTVVHYILLLNIFIYLCIYILICILNIWWLRVRLLWKIRTLIKRPHRIVSTTAAVPCSR